MWSPCAPMWECAVKWVSTRGSTLAGSPSLGGADVLGRCVQALAAPWSASVTGQCDVPKMSRGAEVTLVGSQRPQPLARRGAAVSVLIRSLGDAVCGLALLPPCLLMVP